VALKKLTLWVLLNFFFLRNHCFFLRVIEKPLLNQPIASTPSHTSIHGINLTLIYRSDADIRAILVVGLQTRI
jgi:hypothetical protein